MKRRLAYAFACISAAALAAAALRGQFAEAHTPITTDLNWSEHIRPIFREKCMTCHHEFGVAPRYADLTTYGGKPGQTGAGDWYRAVFEEVKMHHMPPWPADPRFGRFSNSRALTKEELNLIAAWAEGGRPQGPQRDLPTPAEFKQPRKQLGNAHLTLAPSAPHVFPADKKDDFAKVRIPVDIPEDKWVIAFEFYPGQPRVVHSIRAFIHDPEPLPEPELELEVQVPFDPLAPDNLPEPKRMRPFPKGPRFLGQWVRGDAPVLLPEEAGVLLRKGSEIELQIAYRKETYEDEGKEHSDASGLGLFFSAAPVDLLVESAKFAAADFKIPAGAADFETAASLPVEEGIHLLGISPTLGVLGKSFELRAHFPDAKAATLLYIPKYEFKFETSYRLAEPIYLPQGSRLEMIGKFDNSKANPDSSGKEAASGAGPTDPQLVAWIDYHLHDHMIVATPTPTPRPIVANSGEGMSWAEELFRQSDASLLSDVEKERIFTNPDAVIVREPGTVAAPLGRGSITDAVRAEEKRLEALEADPASAAPATPAAPSEPAPAPQIASAPAAPAVAPGADGKPVAKPVDPAFAPGTAVAAPAAPAPETYWCPMRGVGEGKCGLKDYPGPGKCEVCEMALRPKSQLLERYKGKTAPETAEWKLSKAGKEEIYWCVNRGRDDHKLVDYPGPGNCEVCSLALVHKARFEKVRTYTSVTEGSPDFGKIYYGPGLSPVSLEPVSSTGHMDHSAVHGGMLVMAENLYHHVEGALYAKDKFTIFFYDDFKEPLDARNFSGRVVVEKFNEETQQLEQTEYPLEVETEGDSFMTAKIPPVEEFPAAVTAIVNLAGKEARYDFTYEELSVEPPPDLEVPAGILVHGHEPRPPLVIPEGATGADLIAEMRKRVLVIDEAIAAKAWLKIHNPALDVVDLAKELKLRLGDLDIRQKKKAYDLILRMQTAGLELHIPADAGNETRTLAAMEKFRKVLNDLAALYPAASGGGPAAQP